jgi:hypothetical protein
MWWDIAPDVRAEFEDWHSHEHFPERLGIPGFHRGSRWADAHGGEGFFVMYELAGYDTLTSPAYVARLNAPTPWSTRLFPHHRNMVRSQCRVLASFGAGVAGFALTVRFSPPAAESDAMRSRLAILLRDVPPGPGLTGGHLLQTQTPPLAQTAEQKIRGGRDAAADAIVLLTGYDAAALDAFAAGTLAPALSAAADIRTNLFRLSFAATPADVGD